MSCDIADETKIISYYESRINRHCTLKNRERELWLNDDAELVETLRGYISPAAHHYLDGLIKKSI